MCFNNSRIHLISLFCVVALMMALILTACTGKDPEDPTSSTSDPITDESETDTAPETEWEDTSIAADETESVTDDGESTTEAPTTEEATSDSDHDEEMENDEPPARLNAPACDNITLNAYLIPMTSEEERRAMMQLCKDADIDLLSHVYPTNPYNTRAHTLQWYTGAMADAAEYGLLLQVRDRSFFGNLLDMSDEEIRALAQSYADLPGFGGFNVVDEPYIPSPYARIENVIREVFPTTYVNVNFLPRGSYPNGEYIRRLCDYGGLLTAGGTLSLDTYNFDLNGGVNEYALFSNYEDLRQAGLLTKNNTAVYVQSVGLSGNYRRPSGSDLRYNMMAALAYGIKEIKFFTWGTPPQGEGAYTDAILDRNNQPTDLYYEVVKINKKIHAMGTHLAACDATYVYHGRNKSNGAYAIVPKDLFVQAKNADVILSLMEERAGDGEYLFVVNKDFKNEQEFTLTFSGISKVYLVSDETGELTETALTNGELTLTLAAGDATLIKLPEGDFIKPAEKTDKNLALGGAVSGNTTASDKGYYLYNLTDGKINTAEAARVLTNQGCEPILTVDLGTVQSINRVDIYPAGTGAMCGASNPSAFTILVSADGLTWKQVASNTEPLSREYVSVFRFENTDARFIRLRFAEGEGMGSYVDIGELMAYNDDGSIEDEIKTSYTVEHIYADTNLALKKPVVAYSSTTDVPDWSCHHTYINDGNTTSLGWASQLNVNPKPNATEYIVIDLLGVYDVNCIKLYPRGVLNGLNVFPEDYEIQVSMDGVSFTTVKSVTGDNKPQTQDVRVLEFDTTPARFIRLYATKLTLFGSAGQGYGIEMNEMEVYGDYPENNSKPTIPDLPNVALNKPIADYSSTIDEPSWSCHSTYLTDGSMTNGWATGFNRHDTPDGEEWITIDLEAVYDISCVKLVPRAMVGGLNVFPENYEIQVSMDGVSFTTVKAVEGDNIPVTSEDRILLFDATPARYVRLRATRMTHFSSTATGGYGVELNEMEVYGKPHKD